MVLYYVVDIGFGIDKQVMLDVVFVFLGMSSSRRVHVVFRKKMLPGCLKSFTTYCDESVMSSFVGYKGHLLKTEGHVSLPSFVPSKKKFPETNPCGSSMKICNRIGTEP